jgi:hypothetical protein
MHFRKNVKGLIIVNEGSTELPYKTHAFTLIKKKAISWMKIGACGKILYHVHATHSS